MNAPEKIPSLRSEIAQHLADVGEATAKQLAEALIQDRLAVAHTLNDMVKDAEVEREKKRGNEYVYWLSAVGAEPKAVEPAKRERALPPETVPTKTYPPSVLDAMVAEMNDEMPPADPALLAMANRELSHQLEEKDAELLTQTKVVVDLRQRITELDQQLWSLATDVTQTRTALNNAINESDRLRRELTNAQEVTDSAVGYLVRASKRKLRYLTKVERAQDVALAAVRAGAGRAEVLAVVPVGVARRGAEWRESGPRANGD